MKKLLFLIPLFCISLTARGQLGISGSYFQTKTEDWENYYLRHVPLQEEAFYQDGFRLQLDYWFRLKNLRIEFLPGLSYAQMQKDFRNLLGISTTRFQTRVIGGGLNINLYPFDLMNDCDCPTFSKQSSLFQKGFFIQLGGGVQNLMHRATLGADDPPGATITENEATDLAYNLSVGAGLDLGISDFLTITPFFRYTHFLDAQWEGFENMPVVNATLGDPISDSAMYWLEGGIRIGLHWGR